MKIAYFVSNRNKFPPQGDQIAASITVVTNIINQLKDKHEITLYAAKGSKISGVKIIDLGMKPFIMDSAHASSDWITKAVLGMKQIPIGELFKEADKYDIIHLHTEPIYLAMAWTKLIKTPVLFTSHNEYKNFEKDIFRYYDGKINISALSGRQAERFPMKQKIPIVHNGIEINEFKYNQNAKSYFLFFGRLVRDKGFDLFLELAKQDKDNIYYVAGRGDEDLEKEAKILNGKLSNFKYFGMIPRKSKQWHELISNARALLMPIEYEDTCPLVPLEAMACGTPVIAFPKGALPEMIIDGKTGYIASLSGNRLDSLKKKIDKMNKLSDSAYVGMRKASRERILENFTIERMAEKYEDLYKKTISNK